MKNQFKLSRKYYLQIEDFLNWFRYYYLVKDVIRLGGKNILEIGTGSGLVKNCLAPIVNNYKVLDINPNLDPDFLGDVRVYNKKLENNFDTIIAADVLEHMPFEDLSKTIKNIFCYLKKNKRSYALITVPHRSSNFLFMSPTQIPHVFRVPSGFLSLGSFWRRFIKRKIWIDPYHSWEIGDGNITVKKVNSCFEKEKFTIQNYKKLLYVDYFILQKN
jgi:2-polyprenyl-3-methyl-5-hydroxy-6-metoxy-1,4-benzoquinol methylase